MILAGDIGGTKTLLGLFVREHPRPRCVVSRSYATDEYTSFNDVLDQFSGSLDAPLSIDTAVFGLAGAVDGPRARLTNGTWTLDAHELTRRLSGAPTELLNDLAAMAASVTVLRDDELVTLQVGSASPDGNAAVIAAGTGLGMAALPRIDGRLRIAPSEAGHADFSARTEREFDIVRFVRSQRQRVRLEDVVSGPGLLMLHAFTHVERPCDAIVSVDNDDPSAVSDAALEARCPRCVDALGLFVDAYGAEAGNVALRTVATSGLYVGGGIAPQILPALTDGRFMNAFLDKAPMRDLLTRVPVRVILNRESGLLGAAVRAFELSHNAA